MKMYYGSNIIPIYILSSFTKLSKESVVVSSEGKIPHIVIRKPSWSYLMALSSSNSKTLLWGPVVSTPPPTTGRENTRTAFGLGLEGAHFHYGAAARDVGNQVKLLAPKGEKKNIAPKGKTSIILIWDVNKTHK